MAIASNMALAVGTTVPMSTQQHRLSVIAARMDKVADSAAHHSALLVHTQQHCRPSVIAAHTGKQADVAEAAPHTDTKADES